MGVLDWGPSGEAVIKPDGKTNKDQGKTPDGQKPPLDKGPTTDKAQPVDGPKPNPDGPKPNPDSTIPSKLPPPPAGAVLLRISVDDSTDKTYAGGELLLKGSFKYDAATNVITTDTSWTGPFVPLWDDGPSGLEGQGSTAGDHKLGTIVYMVPSSSTTIEYGVLSPAGWMWPDGTGNAKITVKPGSGLQDLTGFKIAPRAGVDVLFTVDNKYLSGVKVDPGYQAVVIRGNFTHWSPLLCNDEGKKGDKVKGDQIYSCQLSEQIGKGRLFPHHGLLQSGQTARFYVDIGGSSYKKPNGITADIKGTGAWQKVTVAMQGTDLTFAVPSGLGAVTAPAPETGPLPAGKSGSLPGGAYVMPASAYKSSLGDSHFYVPGSYDAHRPMPLLVSLHGYTGTGKQMLDTWKTLAEELGFILFAPMGQTGSSTKADWDLNTVFGCLSSPAKEEQPLLQAVAWFKSQYNINSQQVAVEGFSDGASFTLYMGLNNGSVFSSLLANSAGGMGCKTGNPKPMVYMSHGTSDAILPYNGAVNMSTKLKGLGYQVTFVTLQNGAHVFPTELKLPMMNWWWTNTGSGFPP